jgi:hypothetical protein
MEDDEIRRHEGKQHEMDVSMHDLCWLAVTHLESCVQGDYAMVLGEHSQPIVALGLQV